MTTSVGDKAATLRNRRKSPGKESAIDQTTEDTEPLLEEETHIQRARDDDHGNHNDGYVLTPLVERSMLMRLDIGPFLVGYVALIYLDYNTGNATVSEDDQKNMLLQPNTWVFGLLLIFQAILVLLQQWNVSVKSVVGYTRGATAVIPPQKEAAEAVISTWTHCLIEEKNSPPSQLINDSRRKSATFSGDAGIAVVKITTVVDSRNQGYESYKVATVNFHDICFRCPVVLKSLDLDASLWETSKKERAQISINRTILSFHRVRFPINLPLSFYQEWKGHSTLQSVMQCHHLYGANTISLHLPTFAEVLFQQVLAPFFLFQIFCVALWSLDEYWYYAIFTLFALLAFESTVAYNQIQGVQRLRTAGRQNTQKLWVRRPSFTTQPTEQPSWVKISAQELVPGDVVSLTSDVDDRFYSNSDTQHSTVPADILLLTGSAVVDEALLTGESIPQIKVPFDPSTNSSGSSSEGRFHMQENKQSVIYGGTMLVSTDNPIEKTQDNEIPVPPDNGIVGLVLQVGFETAQGSLLRTIAHSSKSVGGVHTWDTFVFIFLLLCCAVASASLVLRDGWDDETRNRFRLGLHVVIIITSVVPPELPMELSLAVTNSVNDLMKKFRVFCTEHYRIPWAGLVDVCCFDKTGTLTSDQMRLKGVRVFYDDNVEHLNEESALMNPGDGNADSLPWPTVRIMAACNSLALRVTRSKLGTRVQLIGDPLEQAVMKNTGYQLGGSNLLIPIEPSSQRPRSITILHRFAFTSQLKRMTVLATEENSADLNGKAHVVWALTKGAPETLLSLLSKESIPSDYEGIYTYHMSRGRRVLAMGYRNLGLGQSLRELKAAGRNKIESNLTFAGFLILDCPLKPDSKAIVSEIRKSDHRVVMITGDAVLTAAEISKQVGIITTGSDEHITYWLQELSSGKGADDPLSSFGFVPLVSKHSESHETIMISAKDTAKLQSMAASGTASFCLTGDILIRLATVAVSGEGPAASNASHGTAALAGINEKNLLLHPKTQMVLTELVKVVSVFARHAPHQKEAVVAAYNLSGHYTLYCGDGTNDTPSLKCAHVGVSIISAPDAESKQRKANASMKRLKKDKKKAGKGARDSAGTTRSMEETMRLLREAQEEIDHVELGDASMASPFTSKQVSIVCCKNVLQQGRCTLVTMLQIYKILGINCLVNAMVLSTLSIYGVKQGDRQLTMLGTVVAALFLFVTRAKPLDAMSPARPPSTVLCTQVLLSIILQFAIHFATILLACMASLAFVDPYDPSIVADGPFNPNILNTCTFLLTVLATINTFAVNYRGRPFTENLHENKLLFRSLVACYASLFLCALEAFPPLNDLLQLSPFPEISKQSVAESSWLLEHSPWLVDMLKICNFPTFMCLLMLGDTTFTFLVEQFIVQAFEG